MRRLGTEEEEPSWHPLYHLPSRQTRAPEFSSAKMLIMVSTSHPYRRIKNLNVDTVAEDSALLECASCPE